MKCSTQKWATSSGTSNAPVMRCVYHQTTFRYAAIASAPDLEHGREEDGDPAHEEDQRADADGQHPEELALAPVAVPEIEEGEANAVQGVQDHRAQQADFEDLEERCMEGGERAVERLGAVAQLPDR